MEVENSIETRTYFVKVTTNGVECITEKQLLLMNQQLRLFQIIIL